MWDGVLTAEMVSATLRIATPIVLVALASAISLKAGIFNIAVEGFMLLAAFLAVVLTTLFGNLWLGLFATIVITVAASLAYGLVTISLKADSIIAGLGVNLLSLGLTSWLLQTVLNAPGGFNAPDGLQIAAIDFSAIPGIGPILARQNVVTVGTWALIVPSYLFLHRSVFGLRLRATGEYPLAAETAGVNTTAWKFIALALTGVLCALAGAALAMGSLGLFTKGMTAGRGFIGFAAASFALGNIPGTVAASYLFAFFSSFAIRVEGYGFPTRLLQMTPYIMTIVALVFARRRADN